MAQVPQQAFWSDPGASAGHLLQPRCLDVPFVAAQLPQQAFMCSPAATAGPSQQPSCLSRPFDVTQVHQWVFWCDPDALMYILMSSRALHFSFGASALHVLFRTAQLPHWSFWPAQVPQWAFGCAPDASMCL